MSADYVAAFPKPTRAKPERARKSIRRRVTLGQKRREAKAAGDLTPEQWEAILKAYRSRCAYCGERWAVQQDHITPLAKGGLHTASNVCPVCLPCNQAKFTSRRWEVRLLPGHPWRPKETR